MIIMSTLEPHSRDTKINSKKLNYWSEIQNTTFTVAGM